MSETSRADGAGPCHGLSSRRIPSPTGLALALLLASATACSDGALPTAPSAPETGQRQTDLPAIHPPAQGLHLPSTVGRLFALGTGPVAIAHRGMGANLGEDPDRPIENTLEAVRQGFATEAELVSYDLQLLGRLEQTAAGSAAQLVQSTLDLGFHVFAGDVSEAAHWHFGAALGVGALYVDDVPLAVSLQPPLD